MRLVKYLAVVAALSLGFTGVLPLALASETAAPSAAQKKKKKSKKCKKGFVKKTVKKKRKGKTVRVKKCVRKKKKAAPKNTSPAGSYNGTTSEGLAFKGVVSRRGDSISIDTSVKVTCADGPQTTAGTQTAQASGTNLLRGGNFRVRLNASVKSKQGGNLPLSPTIQGTISGGKLQATVAADQSSKCSTQAFSVTAKKG